MRISKLTTIWKVLPFLVLPGKALAEKNFLPPLDLSKISFGTGVVKNNQPELSPTLPNIPGPLSAWHLIQWQRKSLITPEGMKLFDQNKKITGLGTPEYSFSAANGHAYFSIFNTAAGSSPIYELYEQDGFLAPGGGSNLFLSTNTLRPAPTFAQHLQLSFRAAISSASVSYNDPEAKNDGAVLGMAFVGLVVRFPDPINGAPSTMFMQLPIANSHNHSALNITCHSQGKSLILLSGGSVGGTPPLKFEASNAPLLSINYDLNNFLQHIEAKPIKCIDNKEPQETINLKNIPLGQMSVRGIYIGLETENRDERPMAAKYAQPQGHVSLGLLLSDVQLKGSD